MKAENQLSFPFGVQKLALRLESLELLNRALLPPLRLLFSPAESALDPPSEEDAAPPSLPPPTLEEVDRLPPPPPPPPATRCRLLMVRRRSRPEGFL